MNPYKILGVEKSATKVDIKKAFAKLVKENPPEKDPQKYQLIREAYEQALKNYSENQTESFVFSENEDYFQTNSKYEKETSTDSKSTDDFFNEFQKKIEERQETKINKDAINKLKNTINSQQTLSLKDILQKVRMRGVKFTKDEKAILKQENKRNKILEDTDSFAKAISWKIALIIIVFIIFLLKTGY